ncbi:MAG: TOMM precursor leader peptide-binding protein, partial [Bryobacterales bacterium]|nr:TOMM precursor leader peptide-binding protein [Bryobacterales bacterium]
AALQAAHSQQQVRSALAALAARGYIVSGQYDMPRGAAAFWSALGASPRWAQERLRAARVALRTKDDQLARQLAAMQVQLVSRDPTLCIVLCDDYLDDQLAAVNQRQMESGTPWVLATLQGLRPLLGPVFRPADGGPCWHCLAYRLRGHQEVHNFLRNAGGPAAAFLPCVAEPGVLDWVRGLLAMEAAKWLVLGDSAALHDHVLSLALDRLACERHAVQRRPQCPACGDPSLYRPDRPPQPLSLQPNPQAVRNSGGLRSVTPQRTLARYRHLVSPVSGVVSWVRRSSDEADNWMHVYWAGSNFALRSSDLRSLRRSLRGKSAGKGSTARQSEASALCEAVERYCCVVHGDEILRRASYADYQRAGADEAIHPNAVQLFSDWQLEHRQQINARGHPLNFVPARLDPDCPLHWSPVWSFTQQRHRYLPTAILYAHSPETQAGLALRADSNGCAAGNTLEEAILQGFLELVERDAFAIWWYNRLSVPGVDLASFDDSYLAAAPAHYARYGREMWLLDITSDIPIPAFVAVSHCAEQPEQEILYGAGAHPDARIAALRAVCELNQFADWQRNVGKGPADPDEQQAGAAWRQATVADNRWLAPSADPPRSASEYAPAGTADLKEEVERCQRLVEAKGLEFLVLDQTRPDIGMPVARVIVPGMRHFWERFAPGRLYDVPVELGRRERALAETDLNPLPVTV